MNTKKGLDQNNMERIKSLMKVKGHALTYVIQPMNTFFSHFSNVVDIPLFFIMNDEISNYSNRGPIKEILIECLESKDLEIYKSVEDMEDLFVKRADFLIGSILLDFNVNAFSTFERWICDIYDYIKPKYPSSDRKKKELISYICKYNSTDNDTSKEELLTKMMAKCNNHVSSMNKIKYVLSKTSKEYKAYTTLKDDLLLIEFLSRVRNTVHTGGFNLSDNDYRVVYNENVYTLNSGEGFKSESHAESILIWNRVIDIYTYAFAFIKETFPHESHEGVLYQLYYQDE